jgi:uncharacterized Fe-S center protein
MDDRYTGAQSSIPAKAQQLFNHAELYECFEPGDTVAVKCHMGEWNNSAYLRPILIRVIVDQIKEHGGKPFVTDTTTAPYYFYGARSTADLYLETAARNGFTTQSMGCPIIISDGLYGTDDVKVEISNGLILKEGYLAKGIAESDSMIVISHFKGHGSGVYGGSIKNIAIGCSSKRGKFNVHMCTHPRVGWNNWEFHGDNCIGEECPDAELCNNVCPAGALKILRDQAEYTPEKCIGCFGHQRPLYRCHLWERNQKYEEWRKYFLIAMGDAASAYTEHLGREKLGYLSYAIDITPACDCVPGSDRPILPNLGVFASRDLVAIDIAGLDMSDSTPGIPSSAAETHNVLESGKEKFTGIVGLSQWITANTCCFHGAGNKEYQLVEPELTENESAIAHNIFTPGKPSGWYLGKVMKKTNKWNPPGGFKYKSKLKLSIEELSKR